MRIPSSTTLRAGRRRQVDHLRQIGAHLRDRQRAQPIVAAQLQDHDLGLMQVERARQARQPARGGFAADAGVDDLVTVPLGP